jgi:hypothetical protein
LVPYFRKAEGYVDGDADYLGAAGLMHLESRRAHDPQPRLARLPDGPDPQPLSAGHRDIGLSSGRRSRLAWRVPRWGVAACPAGRRSGSRIPRSRSVGGLPRRARRRRPTESTAVRYYSAVIRTPRVRA